MKLIDAIRENTNDSESSIIDCYCPSDYGPGYEPYEYGCAGRTCEECWGQEFQEGGQAHNDTDYTITG